MRNLHSTKTLESMSQAVWYNRWTLEKIKPYLKNKILEVGCGIGNFTQTLTNYGEVFAIDIEKNYLERIHKSLRNKAEVGFGDIENDKYFFNGQKFDSIVCLNVLEHIKKDELALKNIYKLLKNQGYLILLVPIHPSLYGKIDQAIGHFRRYTKKDLFRKLKEVGFKIIKDRKLNFLGAIGWFISGKLLKEERVGDEKIKIFNLLAPLILPLEDLIEPPFGTSILIIAKRDN